MTEDTTSYTYEEVSHAVHEGVGLVSEGLSLGSERDTDLINLLVSAIMTRLDEPEASLDEVIRESYDTDPDTVRGWWSSWA